MAESNIEKYIKRIALRDGVSDEKVKKAIVESFTEHYWKEGEKNCELKFIFGESEDSPLSIYKVFKNKEHCSKYKEKDLIFKPETNEYWILIDLKEFPFDKMNEKITRKNKINHIENTNSDYYKVGSLVKGIIKGSYNDEKYLIDLGNDLFGICDKKEFENKSRYNSNLNSYLNFVIQEEANEKIIYPLLTRWSDLFIRKIMEANIPEIKRGEIIIREILRKPGHFSKVLVESKKTSYNYNDYHSSFIGACIGRDGERIRAISKLIEPETIEIASWDDDKNQLLLNLLSPVKVASIIEENKEENCLRILVPGEKISLLLSRGAEKLKIISEYMKKKIKVESLEEFQKSKSYFINWNGNMNIKI